MLTPSGADQSASEQDGELARGLHGRIVELNAPFYAPPPEVIRQLTESPAGTPARAEFLSERSSVARGEPNPHPSSTSTLPKVSGGTGQIPSAGEKLMEDSGASARPMRTEGGRKEAVKETQSLPTLPPAVSRGEALSAGGHRSTQDPLIAALRGPGPVPTPEPYGSQQSGVTLEGPPAVNAEAVAAMEEYRAYLERAIQQRWFIPPEANLLGAPVAVEVVFEISRDGRLVQLRMRRSSGIAALDRAAMNAVRLAGPFRPLPSVYLFESQMFTDKFTYYPPRG